MKGGTRVSNLKKISLPIIVEGRYDKAAVASIYDCTVIETSGFGIFNNKQKQALIRRLGAGGIILLTDSDGGGKQIRSFVSGILPKDKIYHLFIPKIEGKEPRKAHRSAAGTLGVEGVGADVLRRLLDPFVNGENTVNDRGRVTKTDLFIDGLSGGEGASSLRAAFARACDLPDDMTANALLSAINLLYTYDEYKNIIKTVKENL